MEVADIILVSTHSVVREAFVANGIHFTLIYPRKGSKYEYLRRYMDRGSDKSFVSLLDSNWDKWISELEAQRYCSHIILEKGEFLSDKEVVYGKI